MQPLVGTNMPRNLPASIGCQACNTSMAAPKACGLSTSRGMTFSSYVGSAASLQPRKQSLHARHQRQRLASSHAAVLCTLRNFDWPEALLWDCDGVLCDTERDGHRLAFNEAFKQKGLPHEWSVEKYGKLLSTGGGKERMTRYFQEVEDQEPFKSMKDEAERKALVAELHRLKTDIFMDLVQRGTMPLRPGVQRLVREAIDGGVKVAVCSTSNERAVQAIVDVLLGADVSKQMPVFAGDMVPAKKPDPAIYLMAAKELGVDPARCVVIEDSHIGVRAARAAGMRCVVTQSSYTADEDFSLADAVFECIGDAGDEQFSLHDLTTPGSFWVNSPYPVDKDGNRTGGSNGGGDAESAVDVQSESATLSR